MGYRVDWNGSFKTLKPLSAEQAAELRVYEESEEWPGDTPDRRFNPWCVTKDNAGFEVLTDKPGDWKSWLQYTIDHFLKPWGYELHGAVEWDGEEAGDSGIATVEAGRVKARHKAGDKPWAKLSVEAREHVGYVIAQEARSDRMYPEAWAAALAHLGVVETTDRTVFDD